MIHTTKKKLQLLFKKFSYGLFKLFYGRINDFEDISSTSETKVFISEIDKNFKYKIYLIRDGRLYTNTVDDAAFIKNNKLINGPSFQIRNLNFSSVDNNIVLKNGTPRIQKKLKGKVFSLLSGGAGNYNYWHWLFDILPRLRILSEKKNLSEIDFFLFPNNDKKFQKETLEILGIPEKKQLSSLRYRHVKCDEIISTDHPYVTNNNATSAIQNLPNWIIDWLKSSLTENLNLHDNLFPTKFFIDRGDASKSSSESRKIINEREVVEKLIEHNYKIIRLSNYSFIDQMKLFRNAKKVIGLHGAGFANIMFSDNNLEILELKPSGAGKMIENLALKCKVNYDCISIVPEKYNFNNQMGHIKVNIKNLVEKL